MFSVEQFYLPETPQNFPTDEANEEGGHPPEEESVWASQPAPSIHKPTWPFTCWASLAAAAARPVSTDATLVPSRTGRSCLGSVGVTRAVKRENSHEEFFYSAFPQPWWFQFMWNGNAQVAIWAEEFWELQSRDLKHPKIRWDCSTCSHLVHIKHILCPTNPWTQE